MATRPGTDLDQRLLAARQAGNEGDPATALRLAEALYTDAVLANDVTKMAESALVMAKIYPSLQDPEQAVTWADRAHAAASRGDLPNARLQAAAWVVRAWPLALQEQPAQAIAAVNRALELIQESVPLEEQPSLLTSIGLTYEAMGMPIQALGVLRQAADLAADFPNVAVRVRTRINFFNSAVAALDLLQPVDPAAAALLVDEALAHRPAFEADVQAAGLAHTRTSMCQALGPLLHRAGRLEESRALLRELFADPAAPEPRATVSDRLELAALELQLGRPEQAHHWALQAQAAAAAAPAPTAGPRLSGELLQASRLAEARGNVVAALALFKQYHARVVSNEHAAYDARVADLTATVSAQAMSLRISELQQRNAGLSQTFQRLSDLALTDPLTGVGNRRQLEQDYGVLLASGRGLVLLMLDLDHFKQVNDRYSHGVGDAVLRQSATLMGQVLRDRDRIGRFGGEEFTALLSDTALPEALLVAERLRRRVQGFDWEAMAAGLRVTISGGVVTVKAGESFDQAVARADALLYEAKRAGRNRIQVDTPTQPATSPAPPA